MYSFEDHILKFCQVLSSIKSRVALTKLIKFCQVLSSIKIRVAVFLPIYGLSWICEGVYEIRYVLFSFRC